MPKPIADDGSTAFPLMSEAIGGHQLSSEVIRVHLEVIGRGAPLIVAVKP
jgi:hypothetical protein